ESKTHDVALRPPRDLVHPAHAERQKSDARERLAHEVERPASIADEAERREPVEELRELRARLQRDRDAREHRERQEPAPIERAKEADAVQQESQLARDDVRKLRDARGIAEKRVEY